MATKTNTREELLDTCLKLFFEMAPQVPTVEQVAKAAGVSRQAVYLHFKNRSTLILETVRRGDAGSGVTEKMIAARKGDTKVAFEKWIDAVFERYEQVMPATRALVAAEASGQDGAEAWHDRILAIRRSLRYLIERFDSLGRLKPEWSIDEATDLALSRVLFGTWHMLVHECGWSHEKAVKKTAVSLESDLLVPDPADAPIR